MRQVHALPALARLARFEDCMLHLPLAGQRAALLGAGKPRHGVQRE
jgi:glutathione S-transferase